MKDGYTFMMDIDLLKLQDDPWQFLADTLKEFSVPVEEGTTIKFVKGEDIPPGA